MDHAPILSTPAEHIFEEPAPAAVVPSESRLSEEQLYVQYEIRRTVNDIRAGKWRRIALQFPDDMLVDAPRVFNRLRDDLRAVKHEDLQDESQVSSAAKPIDINTQIQGVSLHKQTQAADGIVDHKLCILADTSYGACCIDEVAAEHVDAEVVVHYGRSCLSPTARLPVIYVFTSKPIDFDTAIASFKATYPDLDEKICLMADIPYAHNLDALKLLLDQAGYTRVFKTDIIHNPSSLLPNRTIPHGIEAEPEDLKDYSVFHVSSPPTSLLLTLASRIRSMHIFPTDSPLSTAAPEASTTQMLRRRYALVMRLSTAPIFGILINTLSVSNYMAALQHCQDLIRQAGKKSYVFVVGKVNPAKIANFSEIDGWVVIGCWESSLIESKDFYRPIITPFELEVALTDDKQRVWGNEWIGDFSALLERPKPTQTGEHNQHHDSGNGDETAENGGWDEQPSDDEPPEFDLRTGKLVSRSRPMGRPNQVAASSMRSTGVDAADTQNNAHPSSALVQRTKGEVATIGGQLSPAAEFLRSKRTWQGLGSDFEIAYERDENGNIRGAAMEEGRSGVAKGYTVGQDETKA